MKPQVSDDIFHLPIRRRRIARLQPACWKQIVYGIRFLISLWQ